MNRSIANFFQFILRFLRVWAELYGYLQSPVRVLGTRSVFSGQARIVWYLVRIFRGRREFPTSRQIFQFQVKALGVF